MQISVEAERSAFTAVAVPAARSRASKAARDLWEGLLKYWLWGAMALQDIRLRYRGSLLGPFWLTFNTIILIAMMGLLYPHLFHTSAHDYLPYLTIGMVVWQFIQTMINESGQTFWIAQNVILQTPLPFSVFVYRTVARNFLILAHNVVIVPIVFVLMQVPVGVSALWVIPGFALLALNGVWIGLFFGMLCARFRDISPILANMVQVLFFVTPVFWDPAALGKWQAFVALNPLFDAVEVIRAPLLGRSPEALVWIVLLAVTAIGSIGTFTAFARFRARIAYWV